MNVLEYLPLRFVLVCCGAAAILGCGLKQDRPDFSGSEVVVPLADANDATAQDPEAEAPPADGNVGTDTQTPPERGPSVALQQRALAATVRVVLPQADGSGVILGRTGDQLHVLTVAHAVQEGVSAIELFDPAESLDVPVVRLPAVKIAAQEKQLDLAVLRVRVPPEIATVCLPLHDSEAEPIELGTAAYSVGCSHGEAPRLVTETLRDKKVYRIVNDGKSVRRTMWATDEPQESGRSGGPLISVNGTVIGIALGKTLGRDRSLGFYCHFAEIHDYLIDTDLRSLVRCKASDKFDK